MTSRRSPYGTLTLILILFEVVISASWVIRIKTVEPFLGWENILISLLDMPEQNYQYYKAGIFIVLLFVLIFHISSKRKPKKYKLPKM